MIYARLPFIFCVMLFSAQLAWGYDKEECSVILGRALNLNFNDARGYKQYIGFFGPTFRSFVENTPSMHIVDLGAGFGRAASEVSAFGHSVTGITYKADYIFKSTNQYRTLVGRFFEDIPNEDILKFGTVDAALDVYGILTYTTRFNESFAKIHQLLKEDGTLWIVLGPTDRVGKENSFFNHEVILKNGEQMSLVDFLKSRLRGFEISVFKVQTEEDGVFETMLLKKTADQYSLPELAFMGYFSNPKLAPLFKSSPQEGVPPARMFYEQ